MNYADFLTASNGFPLESDSTLAFMQSDYQNGIRAVAKMAGDDLVIVSGLVQTGGSVTSGWILVGGDLVEFQGGTVGATFIIEETWQPKANQNGTLYNRYKTKKAKFGTGAGQVSWADLKRIGTISALRERLIDAVAFENEVVLSGMAVSNIVGSNCDIAAGEAVMDRQFVAAGSYSGAFPVWLKPDGAWVTVQPSGTSIKFDPQTSQRWADVFRRASAAIGDVKMAAVLSANFDATTGLGKWDQKGWALCNGQNGTLDLRGRTPFGVWLGSGGGDPIYDSNYGTVGNAGGEKAHVLTIPEMPRHNHTENTTTGGAPVDPGEKGLVRRTLAGQNLTTVGVDSSNSGTEPDVASIPEDIPMQGNDQAHENRPPYRVLAFIQRIN